MKKTGIELIAEERKEQIEKHGRPVEFDVKVNHKGQLRVAAMRLLLNDSKTSGYPTGWDREIWRRMRNKSIKERLIIAGALISAELDRIQYLETQQAQP